jgi:ferredoxin
MNVAASGVAASVTYSVEFAKSGVKHQCPSSALLLTFAESHGIDIPNTCRVGQCGTCATRVLDGEVDMEVEDGLDPALREQGYRLMCVARPRGDLKLDA